MMVSANRKDTGMPRAIPGAAPAEAPAAANAKVSPELEAELAAAKAAAQAASAGTGASAGVAGRNKPKTPSGDKPASASTSKPAGAQGKSSGETATQGSSQAASNAQDKDSGEAAQDKPAAPPSDAEIIDELRDRYARLQAEWENYRKRTASEREQERARATMRLVDRLLPVLDDLQRASEHAENASVESLTEGINAVHTKLSEILSREGLKVIDPAGEPFDANLHQAVGKVDDPSLPDETVTEVYQKGYEMAERVLRTAMVIVSTGGPSRNEQ